MEMTQTIHDVAAETARRALLHGDPHLAAEAADAGLRASPDDERLWRYAIRAAHPVSYTHLTLPTISSA